MPRRFLPLLLILMMFPSPATGADDVRIDGLLALAPADVTIRACLIVPSLKRFSDDVRTCLRGMDRDSLLLGARPIDQVKSALAVGTSINDKGALAVYHVTHHDPPADAAPDALLVVVPVMDAATFFEGNFEPGDSPGAYVHPSGTVLFGRATGSSVLLGTQRWVIEQPSRGDVDGPRWLRDQLDDAGEAMLGTGELVVFGNRFAMSWLREHWVPATLVPHHEIATGGLFTLDFDPLAAVVRTYTQFDVRDDVNGAGPSARSRGGLDVLSARPYFAAGSVDVRALRGAALLAPLAPLLRLDLDHPPAWLDATHRLDFAAYRPATPGAPMLKHMAVVVQSADPGAAAAALREAIEAMAGDQEVTWTADDAGQRFSVTASQASVGASIAGGVLTGRAGVDGTVSPFAGGVILTFSHDPVDVEAARRAAESPGSMSLAKDFVVQAMHEFMPPSRDLECYVAMGAIEQRLRPVLAGVQLPGGMRIPELNADLEPIGFSAQLHSRGVETSTIVPSRLLTAWFDELVRARGSAQSP